MSKKEETDTLSVPIFGKLEPVKYAQVKLNKDAIKDINDVKNILEFLVDKTNIMLPQTSSSTTIPGLENISKYLKLKEEY